MLTNSVPSGNNADRIATLEHELRARTFELDVLHEMSMKIGESMTYEQLSLTLLTHLQTALRYDVAASLLVESEGASTLQVHAVRPLGQTAHDELEQRLKTAWSRLSRLPLPTQDFRIQPISEEDARGAHITGFSSFFQIPILTGSAIVGMLFIGAETPEQFEERHLRMLYTVANQAAAAVQRMQAFLEAGRRRLVALVKHLPEGVVLLDAERRVLLFNPAGEKYLAAHTDGKLGEPISRVADHPFDELQYGVGILFRTEGPVSLTLSATVVRLNHDQPDSLLLVFRDETEMREAVRRRDNFLAMLGHELRNPLAAVTTATDLLHHPSLDATRRGQALDILARQVRNLKRLVDDLLDTSRILHGKVRVERLAMDLRELVQRTAKNHTPTFTQEGKSLLTVLESVPVLVLGDEARLQQVLDNLLTNARKFTPPGGEIYISCQRIDTQAVVVVRDTGEGIAPEKQAAIFDPFVQVDATIDRSRGGLGLGLAMVKSVVEMHDGMVTVQSNGKGQGSTFTVRIPVAGTDAEASSRATPDRSKSQKRILIVEDEPDVREVLEHLLRLEGHDIATASNGAEAIEAFELYRPDACLIDIGLPGMDGFQIAKSLENHPHRASARLVAMTGYAQPEDIIQARHAGFDLHLAKPIGLENLLAYLSQD